MIPRSCSGPVRVWGQEPWYGLCRKRTRTEGQAFGASSSGLALETFAIGMGSFVFARLLGGAAVDTGISGHREAVEDALRRGLRRRLSGSDDDHEPDSHKTATHPLSPAVFVAANVAAVAATHFRAASGLKGSRGVRGRGLRYPEPHRFRVRFGCGFVLFTYLGRSSGAHGFRGRGASVMLLVFGVAGWRAMPSEAVARTAGLLTEYGEDLPHSPSLCSPSCS
jgi:hypothetical protein